MEPVTENKEQAITLYEKQMELFKKLAEKDWEEAAKVCGLWQLHGLTPDEKMKMFEKFGLKPIQAQEFYNLGVRAALNNDYKDAEKNFKLAIESNPQFSEAIYNLALTYEHLNNMKKSVELWELYLEKIGSHHPDYASVRSHIRTLKKKEE